MRRGVLARWASRLPLTEKTPLLTLGEGDTPLVAAPSLARDVGCAELWLKFEGQNPTGSFKDRGMVVAVAKALEAGLRSAVCASTGNTSASAAAYCAAAGIACNVVVPEGKVALGKMAQAVAHGARIVVLRGNFDAALVRVREVAARRGIALLNSVNPHRIEGQKTAAFEVAEALGRAPDVLALPVGNAGNITAYWRGFTELGGQRPVLLGFQAAGAAPLVSGSPVARPDCCGSPGSRRTSAAGSWSPFSPDTGSRIRSPPSTRRLAQVPSWTTTRPRWRQRSHEILHRPRAVLDVEPRRRLRRDRHRALRP